MPIFCWPFGRERCVSLRHAVQFHKYLSELIDLVKRRLPVQGGSIFYKTPVDDMVQCLATTGIEGPDGKRWEDDRLTDVIVEPGRGWVGGWLTNAAKLRVLFLFS